jgi:hypothetical protein
MKSRLASIVEIDVVASGWLSPRRVCASSRKSPSVRHGVAGNAERTRPSGIFDRHLSYSPNDKLLV